MLGLAPARGKHSVSDGISTLVRAFELARHGPCQTMEDLRNALKSERREGIDEHLNGQLIIRQLLTLMEARAA